MAMVPDIKAMRHTRILEIIKDRVIETQEELLEALAGEGIHVTQATVSRDIKELGLVKRPIGDGRYRYYFPQEGDLQSGDARIRRLLVDSVVSIDFSENLIVVKTLTGNAHAVAAAIDSMRWEEVLGTVAGDDTILIVVKSRGQISEVLERFVRLRGHGVSHARGTGD